MRSEHGPPARVFLCQDSDSRAGGPCYFSFRGSAQEPTADGIPKGLKLVAGDKRSATTGLLANNHGPSQEVNSISPSTEANLNACGFRSRRTPANSTLWLDRRVCGCPTGGGAALTTGYRLQCLRHKYCSFSIHGPGAHAPSRSGALPWNALPTRLRLHTSNRLALLQLPFSRGPTHRTCLLYTSPSPRDKRQSRMPSSA